MKRIYDVLIYALREKIRIECRWSLDNDTQLYIEVEPTRSYANLSISASAVYALIDENENIRYVYTQPVISANWEQLVLGMLKILCERHKA